MASLDNVFVNRQTPSTVCRVTDVTDSHAILAIESHGALGVRTSKYSMPIAEYDGAEGVPEGRRFLDIWRPATAEDFGETDVPATFRPPATIWMLDDAMVEVGADTAETS